MPSLLRMPTPAAGVEEATLLEWSLDEGATFATDDVLFIIETDKAVIDVEAETDGVLHRVLVTGGRQVAVGTPVAVIGTAGDSAGEIEALIAEISPDIYDDPATPDSVPEDDGAEAVAAEMPAPSAAAAPDVPDLPASADADRGSRIFASPIARLMAKNAGLDLAALSGTGPEGRIVRRDVTAAIAAAASPAPTAPTGPAPVASAPAANVLVGDEARGYTDEPHTRLRSAIAARLTYSKQQVPHFYVRATVRMDALLELRAALNGGGGQKISVNDLIMRAVARAHRQFPAMNVTFGDEAIRHFDYVDVAVAISTDGGLVTPVLRDVDRTPISVIAATTVDYAQRARAGRLRQHELEGGTITVTNLGMFGTEEFDAIINPPHSAILAVGAARREPVVENGPNGEQLAIGTVAHLALSVDHRALDGVIAAQWMGVLTELIENPVRILA